MKAHQDPTYLTTDELAVKIKYDSRTIRARLKDSVLLEGTHYTSLRNQKTWCPPEAATANKRLTSVSLFCFALDASSCELWQPPLGLAGLSDNVFGG